MCVVVCACRNVAKFVHVVMCNRRTLTNYTYGHTHTHSLRHTCSYCSSQSEDSFSENSLPRDMAQRKRLFRNHSHSISLHPSHRHTLSAHEYEDDSDDKPPPQAWTAVGGGARGGAREGYSSDLINYNRNPIRERFTDGK